MAYSILQEVVVVDSWALAAAIVDRRGRKIASPDRGFTSTRDALLQSQREAVDADGRGCLAIHHFEVDISARLVATGIFGQ